MLRPQSCSFLIAAAALVAGCDQYPVRQFRVTQRITNDLPASSFDIDLGGLPPDWVDTKEQLNSAHGPVTSVVLRNGHRVKVVLVPEDNFKISSAFGSSPASQVIYITWYNYDSRVESLSDPERARYYVNGSYVGTGSPGFKKVLRKMELLPEGSRIHFMDINTGLASGGNYRVPYADVIEELIEVMQDRKLEYDD